jgi:Flp pilus assembly protein TadG
MSQLGKFLLRRVLRDESGQTLVWAALLLVVMMGMGGIVVDLGHAYVCYRELQASTDAAALAAASQLPITTTNETSNLVVSTGKLYSSQSGGYNAYPNLNAPYAVTGAKTTVTPGCVTVTGLTQCSATLLANAVQVTQTTTIPTMFIRALSFLGIQSAKSLTLSASAFAEMRGARRGPYNVALVLDTTASMASGDGGSNCTGSKIQCAEQGAQILLSEFSPCLPGLTSCGTATNGNVDNPVDEVSLFTFPAQTPGTQVDNDESYNTNTSTNCTGKNANPGCPSVTSYPDTIALTTLPLSSANLNTLINDYQVVPLSTNYRTSDATATGANPLTTSKTVTANAPSLVNAVGGNSYFGGTAETGMMAQGGVSTFYAGALFTAQQYLAANARPNATNVLILLGDGDANGGTFANTGSKNLNSNGTYPSDNNQCLQAITQANNAKAAGTKVYVVGYGVASGGCSTDKTDKYNGASLTACSTLRAMASEDSNFFVDTSSVKCTGATSVKMNGKTNTLSGIFTAIVGDLTLPRLLPNDTTAIGWTASAL